MKNKYGVPWWKDLDEVPWIPGIIIGVICFFALMAIDRFWG